MATQSGTQVPQETDTLGQPTQPTYDPNLNKTSASLATTPEQAQQNQANFEALGLGQLETVQDTQEPVGSEGSAVVPTNTATEGLTSSAEIKGVQQPLAEQRAVSYNDALRRQNQTFMQKVGAGFEENMTTTVVKGLLSYLDEQDVDPDYVAPSNLNTTLAEHAIQVTSDNAEYLSKASSSADLAARLQALQDHQANMQILADNPMYSVASGILDPIAIGLTASTMGAGSALQFGRIGMAVVGGIEGAGYTALTSQMRIDKATPDEYVVAGLLGFGLGGALGGTKLPAPVAKSAGAAAARLNDPANVALTVASRIEEGVPQLAHRGVDVDKKLVDIGAGWLSEYDSIAQLGPESTRVIDKVAARGIGGQNRNSIADYVADNKAQMLHEMVDWENSIRKLTGQDSVKGVIKGIVDDSTRANGNQRLLDEMIRRNNIYELSQGKVIPEATGDAILDEAVRATEALTAKALKQAKDANMVGTADLTPSAGWFHRAWLPNKMKGVVAREGDDFVEDLLTNGIRKNLRREDTAETTVDKTGKVFKRAIQGGSDADLDELARYYAKAIVYRVKSRADQTRSNFSADLADPDVFDLINTLKEAGANEQTLEHVSRLVKASQRERGTQGYFKSRIPMDLSHSQINPKTGKLVAITDLIDTNIDSLTENYAQRMAGYAGAARAGYGSEGGKTIGSLQEELVSAMAKDGIDNEELSKAALDRLDGILGDFTGIIPRQNRTGPMQQGFQAIASATALANSAIWQVLEAGRQAHMFGLGKTLDTYGKAIFHKITKNPDLADEVDTVFGVNLWQEARYRPWLGQMEAHLANSPNSPVMRFLHVAKTSVPMLNLMKYIQNAQGRVVMNLSSQTLYAAAKGDVKALKILRANASVEEANLAMKGMAKYAKGTKTAVKDMNLDEWDDEAADALKSTLLKLSNSALLMGRTGEGSPWARSAVGKIFGQFLQFVSFAHNKILRRTVHQDGYMALAGLMAYEYPLALMVEAAKEGLSGKTPDNDKKFTQHLILGAAGNMSSVGMFGNLISMTGLTGSPAGMSAAILSPINKAASTVGAIPNLAADPAQAGHTMAKNIFGLIPGISVIPASKLLVDRLTDPD